MDGDNDDCWSSGLSGWAWHELGRQAERSNQANMEFAFSAAARLRGERRIDVNALLAENQRLQNHNAALTQQIIELNAEVHRRYAKFLELQDWAKDVHALLMQERQLRQAESQQESTC